MKWCADEIVEALATNPVGRLFCDMCLLMDYKHKKGCWVGDSRVVRASVELSARG
jgi:hypothetical protein